MNLHSWLENVFGTDVLADRCKNETFFTDGTLWYCNGSVILKEPPIKKLEDELQAILEKEIKKKLLKLHPDKGGDHDDFTLFNSKLETFNRAPSDTTIEEWFKNSHSIDTIKTNFDDEENSYKRRLEIECQCDLIKEAIVEWNKLDLPQPMPNNLLEKMTEMIKTVLKLISSKRNSLYIAKTISLNILKKSKTPPKLKLNALNTMIWSALNMFLPLVWKKIRSFELLNDVRDLFPARFLDPTIKHTRVGIYCEGFGYRHGYICDDVYDDWPNTIWAKGLNGKTYYILNLDFEEEICDFVFFGWRLNISGQIVGHEHLTIHPDDVLKYGKFLL